MNDQIIIISKIKRKSNQKKQNNIMNYMELVIILVVQLPHLVLLGVLVGPENDFSSGLFWASRNIEDEFLAVQVTNQVLTLQPELLVWFSVVFPAAQLRPCQWFYNIIIMRMVLRRLSWSAIPAWNSRPFQPKMVNHSSLKWSTIII